ncbi:MAG: sensor histidine kinase [Polyangiaceae bacterium]
MSVTPDRNTINLEWLIRLRWGQALGQALVIVSVNTVMDLTLPVGTLLAIVALEVASNVAIALWAKRATTVPEGVLAGVLADAVLAEVQRPNPVEVSVDDDCNDAVLLVPERATVRAIRGLVDNACDASASDARVTIDVRRHGARVAFAVDDDGSGMVAEVLERAGEPFFTTKEPGKGMGLGLFLARATAEQLGGTLEITSRHGRGTRAVFAIPAATNDHIVGRSAAAEE